jgi:methyltransferase
MVSSKVAYLTFLALLAGERLVEIALARRNARVALRRGAFEVGRGHFRVMTAFHSLFLVSCAAEVVLLHRPFPGVLGFAALAGALAAQGLRYWAITALGVRWNVRILVIPGLPPVTSGPFRFVRHPNYLAVILEMACVPLIHGCWLTALIFSIGNAVLLWVRIRAEESALGGPYALLFADRPRFLPRLRHEP